jgi:hypothetical protein
MMGTDLHQAVRSQWASRITAPDFVPHFTDTNGTAEPGTIVVGSTPFQRSACTRVTRLGLVPSTLARALMAVAALAWISARDVEIRVDE